MTNKYVSDAIVAYQVPEPGEEPGEDMIEFLGTYPGDWDGDDFGLNFSFPGGVQIASSQATGSCASVASA